MRAAWSWLKRWWILAWSTAEHGMIERDRPKGWRVR